jgi:uncharacterized pyridoxamine 5'-phosphate oxidase family protein
LVDNKSSHSSIERQAKNKPAMFYLEVIMINYVEILKAHPAGVFATIDGTKVRTRVFQFLFADGNKVYFCTNSEKPVYQQLQVNPNVSFCTFSQNFAPVLSVNGKVVFVDDLSLKTRALEENPPIKGIYKTPDNPVFKVFYIDVEEVETFSFEEGPKAYTI